MRLVCQRLGGRLGRPRVDLGRDVFRLECLERLALSLERPQAEPHEPADGQDHGEQVDQDCAAVGSNGLAPHGIWRERSTPVSGESS